MFDWLSGRSRGQEGQGLVEYALIIALVAVVAIGALLLFGQQILHVFQGATSAL